MNEAESLPPLPEPPNGLLQHADWPALAGWAIEWGVRAVLAERERCAKVCEERAALYRSKEAKAGIGEDQFDRADLFRDCAEASEWAADAIRSGE